MYVVQTFFQTKQGFVTCEDARIVATRMTEFHHPGAVSELDIEAVAQQQHSSRGHGVLIPGKVGGCSDSFLEYYVPSQTANEVTTPLQLDKEQFVALMTEAVFPSSGIDMDRVEGITQELMTRRIRSVEKEERDKGRGTQSCTRPPIVCCPLALDGTQATSRL